jgi:hypothetical protein
MLSLPRRRFLSLAAAAAVPLRAASSSFRFVVIADTHIIDPLLKLPEPQTEDNLTLRRTSERLTATRDFLNRLKPAADLCFLVGDYFHDYPSRDLDFYFQNETRLDAAKALTDGFRMPCHVGFGNHDYDVQNIPREVSHELFRRKFNLKPYYSVEHRGFKFIHLNCFSGDTMKKGDPKFRPDTGSLGEEQLNWLEAELKQHKPTFAFVHFPMYLIQPAERADFGLHPLMKKYRDTVQLVVSGHWHKWFEFGRSYGPQHVVIASTRYDSNAYLIVDVDTKKVTHRLTNIDLVDWNTHYSRAFGSS